MSFGTPYPYGTPGGDEVTSAPQIPPVIRVARGNSVVVFLHVNGRLTERLRENVEDVVRILGLAGDVLVAIIVRQDDVVRDANGSDLNFINGLVVTQIAPGVVSIEIGNDAITNAMLQDAIVTAAKIATGAVENAALATDSVDARVIAPGTITAAEIAPGVITGSGLVLLLEDTISGTTKSVNGIFTSAYENYRLVFSDFALGTASFGASLRLRAAGVDNTATNSYVTAGTFTSNPASSPTGGAMGAQGTSHDIFPAIASGMITNGLCVIDMARPNEVDGTSSIVHLGAFYQGLTYYGRFLYFYHTTVAAYDGFTIFSSASMSGKVRVYGYRDTP